MEQKNPNETKQKQNKKLVTLGGYGHVLVWLKYAEMPDIFLVLSLLFD